ncbi:MAG TPA: SMP-30/gluconolactonase/LRE family protein [Acidothermaceae bacterium]|nr:SMP-30/gluconolactonase/LRE family protein [Acidothermaceae bacterium]
MAEYQVALAWADQLGEGPYWDANRQRLFRVDMRSRLVHAWTPVTGACESWKLPAAPSVAIPTLSDALVVAARDEIVLLSDNSSTVLCRPAGLGPEVVLNDGKCDPAGRLWVGSYSTTGTAAAALYRIGADGTCDQMREGLRSSNGLAWNLKADRFYHVDTPTQLVTVADFDVARGLLGQPETFVDLQDVPGVPDGIATDVAGGVWVVMFGGGQVRRYIGDGVLDRVIELPVSHPTSVAFGATDLRTLYITTSRHRLTPEAAAAQPDAGAVFAVSLGVAGTPVAIFGGSKR